MDFQKKMKGMNNTYMQIKPANMRLLVQQQRTYIQVRTAPSRAHTSAKAADVTKLLLLNKCPLTHTLPCRVWR